MSPEKSKEKVKPIYIEPEDEITHVIERIKNSNESHIFLVVPERLSFLQSLVNLKILAKYGKGKKHGLTLVTTDPITQNLASKIGLDVRKSLDDKNIEIVEDQQNHEKRFDVPPAINWWGTPLQRNQAEEALITKENLDLEDFDGEEEEETIIDDGPKKTLIEHADINENGILSSQKLKKTTRIIADNLVESFETTKDKTNQLVKTLTSNISKPIANIILTFSIIFTTVLLFLFIPKVTITIYPKTEAFQQEITIQATDMIKDSNFVTHQIPAVFLEVFEEGGSKTETTGEKFVGTKAKGTIAIKNKRSTITIPAGTLVASSEGVKFKLINDTLIKGAYVDDLGVTRINQNSNVAVEALEVGEENNIKPSDFSITGYNSSLVWGESYRDFSGGSSNKVRVVSQNDADKIKEEVKTNIFSKAHNALQAKQAQGQKIPAESIKTEIIEETINPPIGEQGEEVSYTIKIRTTGIAISEIDLENMLNKSFEKIIPGNYTVVDNSEKTWYELTSVDERLKAINFTGGIEATLVPFFDQQKLKKQLSFKSEKQAVEILKNSTTIELTKDPEFSFWPFYFGRLPLLSSNLSFHLQTSNQ